uniref:Uncharacterized protein n=1 Tax=uncultured Armatimonadetes bacterium TaxID=157466 RepID=A0A6J4JJB6_9BACT|nr:hypothetical protein AVDCRST_MAG63-3480 [uncultured Armatimonadetes bacterium]
MGTVVYVEPSGDAAENATADQVIGWMRKDDEEYWGPYSPMGMLRRGGPPECWLIFLRHPRRGWYLEHTDFSEPRQNLAAVDPAGDRSGWVEHWIEGETQYFLAACFVPQAVAESAVTDFLAGCQPSPAAVWEAFDDEVHRREDEPDDGAAVLETAEPEA